MKEIKLVAVIGVVLMSGTLFAAILSGSAPLVATGIIGGALFGLGIAFIVMEKYDEEIKHIERRSRTDKTS